ncbi:hypothetical protein SpiGrapes_0824 [Sphaerochaeta pleomorpha str. Grapes]|uniref:DUF438 domain-containing protein n=1 Tax=Sphaerochaeta pleomorpha (strain ATCC BAA-1885 / DSM 22778 / Grapes) TaxID=158190 RepID=G8QQ75_SPHPG|nr:DUF438 domain-containing protein [Sphaerochaeta pleomorpha]AEV28652.1 hypothetical protein SpiGrapes_0824 [Sphaerochaeta pleomorpha str. Grapes]
MNAEKMRVLKDIIRQLHAGVSVEEARKLFLEHFSGVAAEEIAEAERQLIEKGLKVEEIQKLCDVHASVFEGSVEKNQTKKDVSTVKGHPAFVFIKENEGLLQFLEKQVFPAKMAYSEHPDSASKERLVEAVKELTKLHVHYLRKENLLFPYLEAAGVTAPPKVMWGVDDEIRGLWKKLMIGFSQGGIDELSVLDELIAKIQSMVTKENTILMPLLMEKLDEKAWVTVAKDSPEIGFCFNGGIEGASPSDAVAWYRWNASLGGEPEEVTERGQIGLPSGSFATEELECVLNSLPCDITFVGKDDKVSYFSEGKERVFPRTRSIIGREVANCHPPKSLKVVEKLIQEFKEGKKDAESFWLQRGGKFVLIRYFAVRNAEKEYLGVLEVTEEISSLRNLEGEKTL